MGAPPACGGERDHQLQPGDDAGRNGPPSTCGPTGKELEVVGGSLWITRPCQEFESVDRDILECMFEQRGLVSSPEVIARFDELFERRHPSTTPESAVLVDRICASGRAENRAAAAQLVAIGELFAYRLSRCSNTEEWAIDTEEAVTAEVAAALRISQALAGSRLRYARAMRERLPQVAEVFQACPTSHSRSSSQSGKPTPPG
jgi:Domain of unknown function (DUF222)